MIRLYTRFIHALMDAICKLSGGHNWSPDYRDNFPLFCLKCGAEKESMMGQREMDRLRGKRRLNG